MNAETLKRTFYSLVAPDFPNEWDVEDAVDSLIAMDEETCRLVLNHVQAIWPVSHSLCFDYVKMAPSAMDRMDVEHLSKWVNMTLDQYEKNGLRAAQRFMADVEKNFLCSLRGETGLQFAQVEGRLRPYLRGLSGRPLDLAPADRVYTDTATVFIPHAISWSKDDDENFFLYKLIVTYQWAFLAGSTFTVAPDNLLNSTSDENIEHVWLHEFLYSFPSFELARDVYHFLETVRISSILKNELPGLMRRKTDMFMDRVPVFNEAESDKGILHLLRECWHRGNLHDLKNIQLETCRDVILDIETDSRTAMDSVAVTKKLYTMIESQEESYNSVTPFVFQGEINLEAVQSARKQRIDELKEQFVEAMATRILSLSRQNSKFKAEGQRLIDSEKSLEDQGIALVVNGQHEIQSEDSKKTVYITINNEAAEAGQELEQAVENIINELGFLPEKYVSSGVGMAGKGYSVLSGLESGQGFEISDPVTYDEWDYRRGDFRKNWCSIHEKDIPLSQSNFLHSTLDKYHGQIVRLRYQFEMMRTSERFVRRQRDGEDIDLDALVDSLADVKAGLPPSDRLFVRLKRDERDIAVLFLIDMSNSTQGWIGRVIKESLVLMCEALEVVGDRYGIYGFSGMRRLRSDFFHIKHIDESYDKEVKERISSIAPREYTRMGPAIRHATDILEAVDSRVKLLITLSDGKPEDYDDYKGEYAIEDTRHALIEAKSAGVHPFCITIDRHAHDYMAHMYGEINYILIDDARKLPRKMPEIYRALTH